MRNIDTIHIELTDRCNLNCNYCYRKYKNNRVFLDENPFDKTQFDIIKNSSIFSVNFTGGEPTLDDRLLGLTETLSSSNKNITVTTNGIKRIESLESINTIIVSVDGFFSEMNLNRNVNQHQYKLISENISYYLNSGKKVQLNLVITKYNLHHFSDFIKNNRFGNSLSYSIIVVSSKTLDKNFVLDNNVDYKYIQREMFELYKFFNYHIQLKSNLMTKASFIDTFSKEYPISFFVTYSTYRNRFVYVNEEFKKFEDLCQSYDSISQKITEEIIRKLEPLDSNDLFNPYSLAELVHKRFNWEV